MAEFSYVVLSCVAAFVVASPEAGREQPKPEEDAGGGGQDSAISEEKKAATLVDFAEQPADWRNIDDVVMGGLSSSGFRIIEGRAFFEGEVSLKNNGGFASVRSRPRDHDLSEAQGVLLRVRGDGKRYAFRLRTTDAFDGISYESRFKTIVDKWMTISIPFEAFRAVYRGRQVRDAAPLNLKSVKSLGFLISDKQAGRFRLEIDWVKAYVASPRD